MFSDKMRSGESLATYIVLGVLHGNTLDAMQRAMRITTVANDLKAGLSNMFVILCISMH